MSRKPITSDRGISSHKSTDKEFFVPVKNYPKLYLLVRPNNKKSWIYRYYPPNTKKQQKISLGVYPSVSLSMAKETWQKYEKLLNSGIDPKLHRDEKKEQDFIDNQYTFNFFSNLYLENINNIQKPQTVKRKKSRIKLLCSYVGDKPIHKIDSPRMLEVLLDIQNKSLNQKGLPTDKAERCAGIAGDIFDFAMARGYCDLNPAKSAKKQLAKYVYGHRPAIIEPKEFAKLLKEIEKTNKDISTVNSLKLLSILFVRNGDLRRVKWSDLNLEEAKWYLKPLKGQGKETMVNDMVVPLPTQAVKLFKEQYQINSQNEYVFYSRTARKNKIISENTANYALKDMGYQGVHCAHGFRATAKTILQERLKYPLILVEMALGHSIKDPNGTAYGRFEYYDERKEMMQKWADYLDALKNDDLENFTLNQSSTEQQLEDLIQSVGKDKLLQLLQENK